MIDSVHEITRFEPPLFAEERITMRSTVIFGVSEVRSIGKDRSVLIMRGRIEWGGGLLEVISRLVSPFTGPPSRRKALQRIKTVIETTDLPTSDPERHFGEEG